jgi:hypothetical protein
MPDTQKVDRPQIHDTTVREIVRDAPAEVSRIPNLSSACVGTTPLSPNQTFDGCAAAYNLDRGQGGGDSD